MGFGTFLMVLVGIVVLGILWAVYTYNKLVTLRNRFRNGWSQIDVQLRRRYDLIPNLVETVKGYAAHESETLEKVTAARTAAMNAGSIKEQQGAENVLSGALKSLFAVSEAYPDLKANQNFMMLQEELAGTESKIAYARQFYNDSVMEYNTTRESFPASMIASSFGFPPQEFFEIEEAAVREPVKVNFTS